ncbi:MAG: penicillin-binding protein 2 [Betaproteobacteria bacterium]|nr:penicillin-binding protein 2 [Betaproteobacteria bacterium]
MTAPAARFGDNKHELQRWRQRMALGLLFAGFGFLATRAVYLQAWHNDFLNEEGEKRVQRVVDIPAHRGIITDRRGEPLAVSTPVESLWINPRETNATPGQIESMARLLGKDPAQLTRQINDKTRGFVYLERMVPPPLAADVKALGITGLRSSPEYRRYYPAADVMAHVLGITDINDQGREGIELSYQSWLAGAPGKQRVIRDRPGNVVEVLERVKAPKPGRDLAISINQHIQYLAYRELSDAVVKHQAKAGAVVVLDARTGEILALVNTPSYNPNSRATLDPTRVRNRAVTDLFEPGSTMKPMLVAAALDSGVVKPETRIDTGNGGFLVGDKVIRDVHAKGVVSIAEALQVSSNVAVAKIALDMKSEDYWRLLTQAGIGAPPKSGMPGEASGRLRPYATWRPIEKATLAFGHGMSVSLLQLAHAYTAFANEGVMPPLTTLRRDAGVSGVRVMKPDTAKDVLRMLERVTQDGGTAPHARVAGYQVAGKTGTARKLVNGAYATKYISSFVGLAPVSNPRLVVAVMLDEPGGKDYYGGLVAAPVFSRVMSGALRFMAIPPDASYDKNSAPPGGAPVIPEAV